MTYEQGPSFKEMQRQVIYGTILGGSSLVRSKRGQNSYLAMRDSDKLWLSYKIETLIDFFKIDSKTLKKDGNTYRCYSIAYPAFNEAYDLFYLNGEKRVTKKVLDILTDEAWMVWFLDAGKKSKRKAYLRTHKFGEKGTKIIMNYFNSLECSCEMRQSKGRFEIVFTNKGAYELLSIIAPKIPEFLIKKFED